MKKKQEQTKFKKNIYWHFPIFPLYKPLTRGISDSIPLKQVSASSPRRGGRLDAETCFTGMLKYLALKVYREAISENANT